MVNTRKGSRPAPTNVRPFISSRTRSSKRNEPVSEEHKEPSSPRLSPPPKRTRRQTTPTPSSSDTSPSPQTKGQRVSWDLPTYCTRLSSRTMQNGHAHKSHREEEAGGGDHSHMNGHVELKRSCRVRKSRFEQLNQSLLFDQLVNSTAEAVLQEMDNISSIRQNREVERLRMWTGDPEEENMDMYSRVKRRKSLRRNTFGMPAHHKVMSKSEQEEEEEEEEEGMEESHGEEEEEDAEDDDEDDEGDEAEEAGEENDRPYNLRQRKTVQRYEAPPIEPVNRKQSNPSLFDTHRSPARRSHIRVKKHAIHSSDTTSSSDEERFERRKSKSMTRARNRCLPMNLLAEDLASGVLRDRGKVGASLADVDPMNLDSSVKFDSVGGLSSHIQKLKEMVVFPLLYPEVFERFKIQPPRGCLFYGPPGTGKTLVARALANECSQGDRKVAFFMRKGADCLSKWVGESERQLRLLFDQAYLMRPSIIFFDEIDGLAPVRSSRQDQIHSSIVSTMLALMDGLDSRGEIVVIGATNRLDSIDPALRRPGRFDREFLFNLPDKQARKHILEIHTRDWNPKLAEPFVDELAEKCVGYCGADIKALCTEAALVALRRRYPQIYGSSVKLQLDISSIVLGPGDFGRALRNIVPASHRALAPPGRALAPALRPLLASSLALVLRAMLRVFPHAQQTDRDNTHGGDNQLLEEDLYSDEDNEGGCASIYHVQPDALLSSSPATHTPFLHFSTSALQQPTSFRPRLLLAGPPGSGQSSHLGPALLHHLDKLPVHRLDLPTLYSVSAKTPEESCAQVFREARRSVPSVVFMPHISDWWEVVSETVKSTFLTLLQDVPSFSPVLILATSETHYTQLPDEVRCMFQRSYGEVVTLSPPGEDDRRSFFSDLLLVQAARPPPRTRSRAGRCEEVLPVAEAPGLRILSTEEQRRVAEQEENTLRELRLFLRDVTKRLATDKRFNIFSKPVDIDEVSDYLEVIRQPMDLSTIMTKIDTHQYLTVKDFLVDIDLICSNALEYNPDKDPGDKVIRHRACSLKDTAHAMFASQLDPEFDRMCEEIKEASGKRDTQTPAQPTAAPGAVATRKPPAAGEEQAGSSTQSEAAAADKHCSSNHIKRKVRRRPSWGRGIIRKKKSHKKGAEEEEGEEPEAELETAGPSDSCLTLDEESSCDTTGPQPNGHHRHAPSTEEESSSEPPVGASEGPAEPQKGPAEPTPKEQASTPTTPAHEEESKDKAEHPESQSKGDVDSPSEAEGSSQAKQEASEADSEPRTEISEPRTKTSEPRTETSEPRTETSEPRTETSQLMTETSQDSEAQPKDAGDQPAVEVQCVNGDASLDSLDSQSPRKSCEAGERTRRCSAGEAEEAQQDEHRDGQESGAMEELVLQDETTGAEMAEEEQEKEGESKGRRCKKSQTEQPKGSADRTEEEPPQTPPPPPLVVDHQRLSALLDAVVMKSEGYSVEQLERLYSLLSQCIYQRRKDYDKTRLLEDMEDRVQHFDTFL